MSKRVKVTIPEDVRIPNTKYLLEKGDTIVIIPKDEPKTEQSLKDRIKAKVREKLHRLGELENYQYECPQCHHKEFSQEALQDTACPMCKTPMEKLPDAAPIGERRIREEADFQYKCQSCGEISHFDHQLLTGEDVQCAHCGSGFLQYAGTYYGENKRGFKEWEEIWHPVIHVTSDHVMSRDEILRIPFDYIVDTLGIDAKINDIVRYNSTDVTVNVWNGFTASNAAKYMEVYGKQLGDVIQLSPDGSYKYTLKFVRR